MQNGPYKSTNLVVNINLQTVNPTQLSDLLALFSRSWICWTLPFFPFLGRSVVMEANLLCLSALHLSGTFSGRIRCEIWFSEEFFAYFLSFNTANYLVSLHFFSVQLYAATSHHPILNIDNALSSVIVTCVACLSYFAEITTPENYTYFRVYLIYYQNARICRIRKHPR